MRMNITSVGGFNSVPMNSSSSSTRFVGPDWSKIPHKGMTSLSQNEIKERVRELGAEFARAGTEKEKQKVADAFFDLQNQYVSHASPDRKAEYELAMKSINKYAGSEKQQSNTVDMTKNIFDFITESKDKREGMQFDKKYPLEGGGSIKATQVTGGGAVFETTNAQGKPALSISIGCVLGNGVSYYSTETEQAMSRELANLWHNSIDYARSAKTSGIVPQDGIDVRV